MFYGGDNNGKGLGGLKAAYAELTTGGAVLVWVLGVILLALLVHFFWTTLDTFIPINARVLNQRTVTNDLKFARRHNIELKLPSKWDPAINPPMASQIMIDNKLRGDELQLALAKLQSNNSPLKKQALAELAKVL